MFKKSLATALLVAAVPAVASASWFLSTQALNAGGSIDTRNKAGQVVTDGSVFKSYTTSANIPVTVTANAGYTIRSITAGGVTYTAPASPWNITLPGGANDKGVTASFVVGSLSVGATVTGGGYVTPASVGNVTYGTTLSAPLTFSFSPKGGYTITGITGVPADPSIVTVIPNTVNQRATVTFPAGYKFTGNVALAATAANTNPNLAQILPVTAAYGATATLTAVPANITNPTYAWTYVSGPDNVASVTRDASGKVVSTTSFTPGPALTMTGADTNQMSFTVPTSIKPGQYKFRVVVTGDGGASADMMAVVNSVAAQADMANQCQFCHTSNNIGDPKIGAQWAKSVHADKQCADCHAGAQSGGHPGQKPACANCHTQEGSDFFASPHWNNSIYTPEPNAWNRSGEDALLPASYASQVSDIQVALEDQDLGNCMNRCHFRPGQGGISIADNFGSTAGNSMTGPWNTTNKVGTAAVGKVACAACHSTGGAAGDGTKGTLASGNLGSNKGGPGLYNDATYFNGKGPNGIDSVVVSIPGVVMSNISTSGDNKHTVRKVNMYQTCLMCHFGKNHGNPAYSYLKSEHYANPYYQYGDKQVQCQDCHNAHSTQSAFPQYDAATYTKTADGACDSCHTGQYSIFNTDSSIKAPHAANKLAKGGAAINVVTAPTASNPYAGWYTGTRNVFLNATSQYVTPKNSCGDCHGHNNSVNAEYAETMHADPYGRTKSASYFKFRGYSSNVADQYTPEKVGVNDGCVRCHTTTGFVNFIESDYKDLRAWGFKDTSDKTGEVINCRACHRTTPYQEDHPEAEAPDAFTQPGMAIALPEGTYNWKNDYPFTLATDQGVRNPVAIRGWVPVRADQKAQVPQSLYKGFYNYSVANVKKFVTGVQFADYKMSNVCVSCHAGRNGATNGDAIKSLAGFSNFTSLGILGGKLPGLPHGVYQSAILNGSIGYQYSAFTNAAVSHANIGTSVSDSNHGLNFNGVNTPGPCVSCHMSYKVVTGKPDGVNSVSTQHRKHNFEIKGTDVYTQLCNKCHAGLNDAALDASKGQFQAAVSALAEIMKTSSNKYGAATVSTLVLNSYGSYDVNVPDRHMGAGSAFNADLVGAGYNLKLLYNVAYAASDLGGYAHNPPYLKQLLKDTINAVRDTNTTTSAADAASKLTGLTSQQKADAMLYLQ